MFIFLILGYLIRNPFSFFSVIINVQKRGDKYVLRNKSNSIRLFTHGKSKFRPIPLIQAVGDTYFSLLELIKPIDKIIVSKIDMPGICSEKSTKL